MADGVETGFHLRLTDDAYAGWKAVADDQGMTTSGLLEMVGRHLRVNGTVDVARALEASTARLTRPTA